MAYSANHMLFSWSGHFITGGAEVIEDFAGGLRFVGPGVGSVQTQERIEDLWKTLAAFVADARSFIPAGARFDHVKWNEIGTDGRYVDRNNTLEYTPIVDASGPASGRYPTQVACATTWTTDFARGRASKGRTYWPTAAPVDGNSRYRLTESQQIGLAEWGLGFIRGMNLAASGSGPQVPVPGQPGPVTGDPATVVAAVMSEIGAGRSGIITGCRVGDRLDIQRRRGNRVDESYISRSFA